MKICIETFIEAPPARCFDLARNIEFHMQSARGTYERAVGGVISGLISAGEDVEWKAKHLGLWWRMRVVITEFDPPHYFQDRMVDGPFRLFTHDHSFTPKGSGTLMNDTVSFESPVPILGRLFDRFVLNKYLRRFLQVRNIQLKAKAEERTCHCS